MRDLEVYEPLAVKKQTIKSATEAASMILRVDDVIASGKMKAPPVPSGVGHQRISAHGGVPEMVKNGFSRKNSNYGELV